MAIEVVEWNSYNGRRYGRPWAAVVTYDAAGRPSYDFKRGSYQGSDAGGTLFVNAKPGDVVAYGQKDSRGNGGTNTIAIVQSDGSVSDTTKAAAFARAANGRHGHVLVGADVSAERFEALRAAFPP